jgi:hypothetical protein
LFEQLNSFIKFVRTAQVPVAWDLKVFRERQACLGARRGVFGIFFSARFSNNATMYLRLPRNGLSWRS